MAKVQKSRSKSKSRVQREHRAKLKPPDGTLGLQVIYPKTAGIDVGNEEHWVAVPPDLDPAHARRRFATLAQEISKTNPTTLRNSIEVWRSSVPTTVCPLPGNRFRDFRAAQHHAADIRHNAADRF